MSSAGHGSELASAAGYLHTDKDNNLIGPDGKVWTVAPSTRWKPLPTFTEAMRKDNKDIELLRQWQLDTYPTFDGSLYVDGVRYGMQGNEDRALRFTTKNKKLEIDDTSSLVLSPPQIFAPQQPTGHNQVLYLSDPTLGQLNIQSVGFGPGTYTILLEIVASKNPSKVGLLRLAEAPGTITCVRSCIGSNNGVEVFNQPFSQGNSIVSTGYTVDPSRGLGFQSDTGAVNIREGKYQLDIRNQMPDGYATADFRFDWMTPNLGA